MLSGRELDEEYVESEEESHVPNVWEQAAAYHVNAQRASTQHVNAQSAAGPSPIVVNTLARAFTSIHAVHKHV